MENKMKKNEMNNTKFTDRMIELRKQKGWSQEDLAERLGVSRQTVSKWELGDTKPKTSKIIEMCKLYNITMDELINGKDESEAVAIDAKVVSEDNTKVIINEISPESGEITILNTENFRNETKKKSFIRKHLRKIMIVLVVILLVVYLGFSAYKFCILKEINDKFNEYKNVDNCYYERKEIVTNSSGTAYIINSKYWYKDGLLKIENIKTENGKTDTINIYVDTIKKERYILYENNKKAIKKINDNQYSEIKNGILQYIIGNNYHEYNINNFYEDILKSNIKVKEHEYIIENNLEVYSKKVYNKENAFIKQNYILNENGEETRILHNIEIGIVKDEDLKIENVNLLEYEFIEEK